MSRLQSAHSKNYQFIFGPVPSRRLGMSLGVDMVPYKTCSFDCIYCECGRTTNHTSTLKEYIPAKEIIDELDLFLSDSPHIDVITFAGSGEPSLNSALPTVIEHVKRRYPSYKTAVLTNSVLLTRKKIRDYFLSLDYVLPSLDAVSQQVFETINKPCSENTIESVIDGLCVFSREFTGSLWLEVFVIPGVNDTEQELTIFKQVLKKINPTRVQLNTLDRPGPCSWVIPATSEQMLHIAQYFLPLPVEIITRRVTIPPVTMNQHNQLKEKILAMLKRRPMTLEDISVSLNISINETQQALDPLIDGHSLGSSMVQSQRFYSCPQK